MNTNKIEGFTLIELMIVIAIIGILSTMAIPSYQDRIIRNQVKEAFVLSEFIRADIVAFYKENRAFPKNNAQAGLPLPKQIVGNYVKKIEVTDGAIHVSLGNRINNHVKGRIVSIRPAYVQNIPQVPIAWVYGYASVPEGMTVSSKNRSDILPRHLPVNCRY